MTAKIQTCPVQGKKTYPTKLAAIRAALSFSRKRGTPLRVYRHGACGGWHLTKSDMCKRVSS